MLDTGSCICKSDTLVPECLASEFRSRIASLLKQPDKDSHPISDEQILNLVNPSMFLLIYGRSLVLADRGQVDLDNVLGSYGHATVAQRYVERQVDSLEIKSQVDQARVEAFGSSNDPYISNLDIYHWSSNYQWLPCEVEFTKGSRTDVHITSYIKQPASYS